METKELGKVTRASFGMGGYQQTMVGFNFSMESKSWAVTDFWRGSDAMDRAKTLLEIAKVDRLEYIVGKPVECTFDDGILQSWRVLTEVL